MVFLLMHFPPFHTFRLFCNFILNNKFIYRSFLFKQKHIWTVNTVMEQIYAKFFPGSYHQLKDCKVEIWNVLWIEWLFAGFLKSFQLKHCTILWDHFLLNGEAFIFRLGYVVFGLINANFAGLSKDRFVDQCKKLVAVKFEAILDQMLDEKGNEQAFRYVDGLLKKKGQ